MALELDPGRIRSAVRNERAITVKTTSYLAGERTSVDGILEVFLEEAGLLRYQNEIAYCVHELASNAHKGNTKRAYFHEQELDIRDESEYARGMERFREEAFADMERYVRIQRKLGLHVRLGFLLDGPEARISVSQNSGLISTERRRVQEKLDLARMSDNLWNVYENAYDPDEGAGLGLVTTVIMLRHIGLHDDVLEGSFHPRETSFFIRLHRFSEELLQTA